MFEVPEDAEELEINVVEISDDGVRSDIADLTFSLIDLMTSNLVRLLLIR